jgi:hypothetical protein
MEKLLHLASKANKQGKWVQVKLLGSGLAAHTAIIAQSGSGKSFALGRLLEEIAGKTRSRVFILDPNSDFAKFGSVNTEVFGSKKMREFKNYLSRNEAKTFPPLWKGLRFCLLSQRSSSDLGLGDAANTQMRRISVSWPRLTPEEQGDALGLSPRSTPGEWQVLGSAGNAQEAFEKQYGKDAVYTLAKYREFVRTLLTILIARSKGRPATNANSPAWPDNAALAVSSKVLDTGPAMTVNGRMLHLEYLEIFDQGTPANSLNAAMRGLGRGDSDRKVVCLDLGSLERPAQQHVAAAAALGSLWRGARESWLAAIKSDARKDERCPIFIVVDEAHNLAPANPTSESIMSVTEALVRIAMEGRKYGLFLILVTQRPGRLNESLFSQCDNLCLMKMSNHADLALVEKTFGFLPARMAQGALDFDQGQMLLAGRFIETVMIARCAPRRTMEGGRSLQAEYWLQDPPSPAPHLPAQSRPPTQPAPQPQSETLGPTG